MNASLGELQYYVGNYTEDNHGTAEPECCIFGVPCIVNLDRNTHVHGDLVCNKQIVTIECCFGYGMICSSLLFYILVDAVEKRTFDFHCVVTFTGTQI